MVSGDVEVIFIHPYLAYQTYERSIYIIPAVPSWYTGDLYRRTQEYSITEPSEEQPQQMSGRESVGKRRLNPSRSRSQSLTDSRRGTGEVDTAQVSTAPADRVRTGMDRGDTVHAATIEAPGTRPAGRGSFATAAPDQRAQTGARARAQTPTSAWW